MRYVFADCRFDLVDPPAARRRYLAGHIPGAVFLDLDDDLSDKSVQGHGRHPLPDAQRFAAVAGRAGIGPGVLVVAYDDGSLAGAARLWWLLRHFGHDSVAVLDGALGAWSEAGDELRSGAEQPAPGNFSAQERAGDTVGLDDVERGSLRLLDAREPERFRGEQEPMDPVAGHIPGARNVPSPDIAPDGRFGDEDQLSEQLDEEPFVAYCGSGITATTLLLAAEIAGVEGRLYPGSWSEWSRRGLPVETGGG
jgi:thiosulfate/3-mercaptopyruvate sulfurtransferase